LRLYEHPPEDKKILSSRWNFVGTIIAVILLGQIPKVEEIIQKAFGVQYKKARGEWGLAPAGVGIQPYLKRFRV
jgi:hypothetical protein